MAGGEWMTVDRATGDIECPASRLPRQGATDAALPRARRGRRYARLVLTALWAATARISPSPSPSPTDLAADTGASFTLDAGIVTAVISAAVAITIAVLTPALQSRQQRRDAVHAKFDAATAALLTVQAKRHVPQGIPAQGLSYPGSEDQRTDYNRATVERGVTDFIDATSDAKAALAEIAQYVPQAREWIIRTWEITEADEQDMRDTIERARAKAVRTVRFLRARGDAS